MIIIGDIENLKELYRGKDKSILSLSLYDIVRVHGLEYRIISKEYNVQKKQWFIRAKLRDDYYAPQHLNKDTWFKKIVKLLKKTKVKKWEKTST